MIAHACDRTRSGDASGAGEQAEDAVGLTVDLSARWVGDSPRPELEAPFEDALEQSLRAASAAPWPNLRGAVEMERNDGGVGVYAGLWNQGSGPGESVELRLAVPCDDECPSEASRAVAAVAPSALALVGAPPERLGLAMDEADEAVAIVAVREAQRRGLEELCPRISRTPTRLETDFALIAAAGASAELGCTEATGPLVAAIDTRRPELVVAVAPALAALGGSDVVGFLQAVASGHEDANARRAAREALRSMSHLVP